MCLVGLLAADRGYNVDPPQQKEKATLMQGSSCCPPLACYISFLHIVDLLRAVLIALFSPLLLLLAVLFSFIIVIIIMIVIICFW